MTKPAIGLVLIVVATGLVAAVSGNAGQTEPSKEHALPESAPAVSTGRLPLFEAATRPRSRLVPDDIAHDCSRDVTQALNTWLAESVEDASVVWLWRDACYLVEGSVTISGKRKIHLHGNGATLRARTDGAGDRKSQRSHLEIIDSADIAVEGLRVRGPNSPFESFTETEELRSLQGQHGVKISSSRRVLVEDVSVRGTRGDCAYIGGSSDLAPSQSVIVRRSELDACGRQGVAVTHGTDVLISENSIERAGMFMVDAEPNRNSRVYRVEISGNSLGRSYWRAPTLLGVFDITTGARIDDITISANKTRADAAGVTYYVAANTNDRYRVNVNLSGADRAGIWNPGEVLRFTDAVRPPEIEAPKL